MGQVDLDKLNLFTLEALPVAEWNRLSRYISMDEGKAWCKCCNVQVLDWKQSGYIAPQWETLWHQEERDHIASVQHLENVLLFKLAGEDLTME